MNCNQSETVSIHEFLAHYGHIPIAKRHKGGVEIRYHSPLREDDRTASFDVNAIKNAWYDLGLGRGGGIVQLAQEMFSTDVSGALKAIDATNLYHPERNYSSVSHEDIPCFEGEVTAPDGAHKPKDALGKARINAIKPLGNNGALVSYLKSRGINPDIAAKYLSEIYFTRDTLPDTPLFTLGMLNNSKEGYAVNNLKFKGFLGDVQDITSINIKDGGKLALFEGWPDFLSYLSHYQLHNFESGALILNSTALKNRAIKKIRKHTLSDIYLFLDNDIAGQAAARSFVEELSDEYVIKDRSSLYQGYKDFNEWALAALKAEKRSYI